MKRLIAVLLCAAVTSATVIMLCSCKDKALTDTEPEDYTASEITRMMSLGWNLGNTLDAPDGETSWGQPETTEDMINKLSELGFKSIRIPTSWGKHNSGAPDYKLDKDWLDRVQQVVDWAIDRDMFVILNSHHDNDFYYPSKENGDKAVEYISAVWSQVAERFADYDQHLVFEAMNEPRLSGTPNEWNFDSNSIACLEAAKIINRCNQACVDAVRQAGGRNTDRYIMVTPYAASPYSALANEFLLPDDTSQRLLLSVHAYTPYNLAMNKSNDFREFDEDSKRQIDDFIDKLNEKFVKNGTYVVIGEMGCTNKGNHRARKEWGEYYVSKAKDNNMPCFVWDNGYDSMGEECYALFDRHNLKIYDSCESYYEGLIAGAK